MTYTVTASHVNADYASIMQGATFADDYNSEYRICRDETGYYARGRLLGCGRTCSTPEAAIRSLLVDNGYTNICVKQPEPEPEPEPLYLLQLPYLNEGESPVVVKTTRRDAEMLREHGTHKIIGGDGVFVVTPITTARTNVTFQIGQAAY